MIGLIIFMDTQLLSGAYGLVWADNIFSFLHM